jgi:hypothetical protein
MQSVLISFSMPVYPGALAFQDCGFEQLTEWVASLQARLHYDAGNSCRACQRATRLYTKGVIRKAD